MNISRRTTRVFFWNDRHAFTCAAKVLAQISRLTICLTKRCGCMKKPNDCAHRGTTKRSCDGIRVHVLLPGRSCSQGRWTIFHPDLDDQAAERSPVVCLPSANFSII